MIWKIVAPLVEKLWNLLVCFLALNQNLFSLAGYNDWNPIYFFYLVYVTTPHGADYFGFADDDEEWNVIDDFQAEQGLKIHIRMVEFGIINFNLSSSGSYDLEGMIR